MVTIGEEANRLARVGVGKEAQWAGRALRHLAEAQHHAHGTDCEHAGAEQAPLKRMEHKGTGNRSVFASRITLAWEDLKTAERRAAYDTQQQGRAKSSLARSKSAMGRRTSSTKMRDGQYARHAYRTRPPAGLWRTLLMLFGVARR